jgi:hypothetical protein
MSSKIKNEIYTCVGILLLILAIGLYVVYSYFGLWPFVIGGFFVAVFAAWVVYSSHKAKKHPKPVATIEPAILSAFQHSTPEERQKMLEERGFTQYTDENGNIRWKAPPLLKEWANAGSIDLMLKDGSVEMKIEREGPKIRCSYCGTVYEEKLDKCPNCGASRQGNEEVVQGSLSDKP